MFSASLIITLIFFSYLIGSICSAIIVSKLSGLPDPRTTGSHNPGATNMLRIAGKKSAIIVLLTDMVKGFLPVLILKCFAYPPSVLGFACLAAVLGHMFPIFFRFEGGKGVATALGGLYGINFIFGIVVTALWLLIANVTRYSSLASICSLLSAPLFVMFTPNGHHAFFPLFCMTIFIVYKHRENITRLIDGEEPKIKLSRNSLSGEIEATLKESEIEEALDAPSIEKTPLVNNDAEHSPTESLSEKNSPLNRSKKESVKKPKA